MNADITTLMVGITISTVYLYASFVDMKTKRVPFMAWSPIWIVCAPIAIYKLITTQIDLIYPSLFTAIVLVTTFYAVGMASILNGADVWAFCWVFIFYGITANVTMYDAISFVAMACIIGLFAILLLYIAKKKLVYIPFVPAITGSFLYHFLFGALL